MPVCEVPNTYKTCKEAANYLVNKKCGEGLQVLTDNTAADFHKIHPKCERLDAGDVRIWPFLYHIFGKPIVLECPEIECPKKEEPAQNIPQSQPVENINGKPDGGVAKDAGASAKPAESNGTKVSGAMKTKIKLAADKAYIKIKEYEGIGAGDDAAALRKLVKAMYAANNDKKAAAAIKELEAKIGGSE